MPRKTDYHMGLEAVLNNPATSFLHAPKVFHEVHKESGMTMAQMMRHIGKGSRDKKNKRHEPTDEEKSEARLNKMEETGK